MAISAVNENIEYYSNDSITKLFTIVDDDGAAIDVGSDTLILTVRKKKGGAVIETLSTTSEITVTGAVGSVGTDNIVNVAFNHGFDERAYVYDLFDETIDQTLRYGLLIVTGEVHA